MLICHAQRADVARARGKYVGLGRFKADNFEQTCAQRIQARACFCTQMRVEAENGATAGKTDLAKRAKAANLDAIHDTVHEMARDEARHGKAFAGLLKRYFGE